MSKDGWKIIISSDDCPFIDSDEDLPDYCGYIHDRGNYAHLVECSKGKCPLLYPKGGKCYPEFVGKGKRFKCTKCGVGPCYPTPETAKILAAVPRKGY